MILAALFVVYILGYKAGGEEKHTMKSWHVGIIVAVLIGYALGILFPAVGQSLKSKIA